eukprot:scaffold1401_cov330-Pavlova_lutheri.AAC.53
MGGVAIGSWVSQTSEFCGTGRPFFAHKLADGFEGVARRFAEHLEERHLRRGGDASGTQHASHGHGTIQAALGGDGIDQEVHVHAVSHEFERGLHHAHVRFHAAQEDLGHAQATQLLPHVLRAHAESQLLVRLRPFRQAFAHFRHGASQRLGILLRHHHRHSQYARAAHRQPRGGDGGLSTAQDRSEPFLHVAHQQRRLASAQCRLLRRRHRRHHMCFNSSTPFPTHTATRNRIRAMSATGSRNRPTSGTMHVRLRRWGWKSERTNDKGEGKKRACVRSRPCDGRNKWTTRRMDVDTRCMRRADDAAPGTCLGGCAHATVLWGAWVYRIASKKWPRRPTLLRPTRQHDRALATRACVSPPPRIKDAKGRKPNTRGAI